MVTIKDYLIILRIRGGDVDAWEILVEKYYDKIFHYCRRRFFGNQKLAEDLTQDTFMKVIAKIDTFKFSGSFFNYLFTVAVNTCNNYSKKHRLTETELEEGVLSLAYDPQNPVEKKHDSLQDALNKLPEFQREAIILKFYYDLKVKEIAVITNTSVPTAQSRINQGLEKLRKYLGQEEGYFEKI